MPSINMIATRRAERKKLEQQVRVAALIVLCQVILGCAILSFMTARIYATDRAISKLNKQLATIQPTVRQIAEYEAETKQLEPRLKLLADSKEKTLLWYSIMQNLSRSMPADTWLTDITTSVEIPSSTASKPEEPRATIKLRGTSVSQMMVGETMLRLNKWPEFSRVDLSYTQQSGNEDVNTVEFEINAPLRDHSAKGGISPNGSH